MSIQHPSADTGVSWHADGFWTADLLLPAGTLVARCDKHLAFLQLHHGARRVSLAEAQALLGATHPERPWCMSLEPA